MQTWTYPVVYENHGEDGWVTAFPDVPEALTGAPTLAETRVLAADALEEAILAILAAGRPIPEPSPARPGQELVALDPVTAARAALAAAMKALGVSNTALASRLGKSEGAVRRLVDGSTGVKIDTVLEALRALGLSASLITSPRAA